MASGEWREKIIEHQNYNLRDISRLTFHVHEKKFAKKKNRTMHQIFLALDWALAIEKLILVAIIVSISLVIAMYETYAERKIAAFIQDRRGPNRAGPFGIFQPLADGLKLFMKEEIIPSPHPINFYSSWSLSRDAYGDDDQCRHSLG